MVALTIEQPAWGQVRILEALNHPRLVDFAGWGALRVAAPRPHVDEVAPEGTRSQGAAGRDPVDGGADRRPGEELGRAAPCRCKKDRHSRQSLRGQ